MADKPSGGGDAPNPLELCIPFVGTYTKPAVLERMLQDAGIPFTYVAKPRTQPQAFVGFATPEERTAAEERIRSLKLKGRALTVRPAFGSHAHIKRPRGEGEAEGAEGAASGDDLEGAAPRKAPRMALDADAASPSPRASPAETTNVQDVVTPWWNVPYEEQLARKTAEMRAVMRKLAVRMPKHMFRNAKLPKGVFVSAKQKVRTRPPSSSVEGANTAGSEASTLAPTAITAASATADGAGHASAGSSDIAAAIRSSSEATFSSAACEDAEEQFDEERLDEALRSTIPSWLLPARKANNMQACPVLEIVPAPKIRGYRNKAVFTIGWDPTGKPTAGSRIGSFAETRAVARSDASVHYSVAAEAIAAAVDNFLRSSPLSPYEMGTRTGVWRQLTIRSADSTGDVMVILMAKPPKDDTGDAAAADASSVMAVPASSSSSSKEMYRSELQRFVSCMHDTAAGQPWHITSIFLQEYDGSSTPPPNHPHTLLDGADAIIERMCGLSFRISPGAFFQVNTPAAERLYTLTRALALDGLKGLKELSDALGMKWNDESSFNASSATAERPIDAVIDVCCGTGTIGLVCAGSGRRIVGVELAEEAIADAKENARLNDVSNVEFIADRAENVLRDMLTKLHGELATQTGRSAADPASFNVVAIVDPPRSGLHSKVIRALRTCKPLRRIVYVSCNPTGSFIEDAVKFTAPQEHSTDALRGPPFRPIAAVPVDLFPHTPHCELVTLFERD